MLTNRMGLPDALVAAVLNDPYSKGDSDISVTTLISPPYQRKLKAEHEPVEDVSDRIWSLLGQATHTILERAYRGKGEVEERLFMPVNGWTVSGQYDVIEDGVLHDYKITSVWSVKGDTKLEWEQQLNLLRLLAHYNDKPIRALRIIAILRDWQKSKARTDSTYPQAQVVAVDIPMWPLPWAIKFMEARVLAHQADTPPPCTDEERWKTDNVYAVMKEGRKTAVKLHEDKTIAITHAAGLGKGHTVVERPGQYRRCAEYCPVSTSCPQFASEVPF